MVVIRIHARSSGIAPQRELSGSYGYVSAGTSYEYILNGIAPGYSCFVQIDSRYLEWRGSPQGGAYAVATEQNHPHGDRNNPHRMFPHGLATLLAILPVVPQPFRPLR